MGYNTIFKGELRFTHTPTVEQLAALNDMFGEDCREHPEWEAEDGLSYVDLRLTKDLGGIQWDDETEKTYYLERIVNVVIRQMRKRWPEFGLTGTLSAQGEDAEDRWALVIGDDGMATKAKIAVGPMVRCPHCRKKFAVEEAAK